MNGTLLGVSAVDATHAWAVGYYINGIPVQPIIVATADGGITWTRLQAPHNAWLTGVSFVNQSTGWIVGNTCAPQAICPEVSVTHDGGITWVDQSQPLQGPYAVRFVSATTGWVVGIDGIAGTSNGGVNWSLQSQPANVSLFSVWAIDSTHAWAVGSDTVTGNNVVYATSDGSTWSQTGVLPTNFTSRTGAAFFIDANNGWVAGRLGGSGAIEVTHDAGLHWNPQTIPSGISGVFTIAFATSTIGWAAGADVYGTGPALLATTDAGVSWSAQTTPNSSGDLTSIAAVSSTAVWVVGRGRCSQASILATSNGGTAWTDQLARPPVVAQLNGVATIGSSDAWAAGVDSCGSGVVLTTNSAGSTWSAQTVPPDVGSLLSVSFGDASHGWAAGELRRGSDGLPVGAAMVATTDGGATWVRQTIPAGIGQLTAVKFVSASVGWAIGSDAGTNSGDILVTTNGGATWARQQIPSGVCCIAGLWFTDALHGWAGGFTQAGTTGVVLSTNDGGSIWTSLTLPTQALLGTATPAGICFSDSTHGWVVGLYVSGPGGTAMIDASVDGGATWSQQTTQGYGGLAGVTCPSASVAWVVGSPFSAIILATTYGGTQWSMQGAPSDLRSLQGVAAASTTLVWAVGSTVGGLGVVLNTTNAGTTWTEQAYSYPPALPSAPTQVTAKSTGNRGEVHVAWQPPSSGPPITGYDVNVYNSKTRTTTPNHYGAGVTSATIGQLNNCTSYRFDVYAVAASGSSDPAPSVYATPYAVASSSDGSPKYVAILVGGTNTENLAPTPDYQPLGIGAAAFCFGSDYINGQPPPGEAAVPPQLKAIGDTWKDDKSLTRYDHPLLTSQLAAVGAVILPFSYNRAFLSGTSADPLAATFHFDPFTKLDVTLNVPPAEASVLESEVWSVNNIWPSARIVIVGHSLGGLIAELWWEKNGTHDSGTTRNGVAAVFSLDAPISGVLDTLLCTGVVAPGLVPFCTFLAGVGPLVANWYFASWLAQNAIWSRILNLNANGQYIPVGTWADNLYAFLDFPSSGLISQLVFSPACLIVCNPAGDDFVSEAGCNGTQGDLLDDHSFVKNCPNVVKYIGCVLIAQAPGCPLPTTPGIGHSQPAHPRPAATVPPITGTLSPSVLSPGQSATITGTGLGTTPGLVQFMGAASGLVNASVSGWTDTQISLTVPVGATTGPVGMQTSAGISVIVGEPTVLAPANGVANVAASLVGLAPIDGHPASVAVLATDRGGKAVPNATVGLSNGVGVVSGQTDAAGQVTLQMPGFGTIGLVAYSGSASTTINVTWMSPPPMTLALATSSRTPAAGAPITIWATLDDASGKSVSAQPVAFRVVGPASITLSNSIVSTDNSGTATIAVTNTGDGPFIVSATADSYAANASIAIRPILPLTGTPAAPSRIQATPGDREVTVAWSAPDFMGGGPITGYKVTASPGGATTTVSTAVPAATVTGLTNGTPYTFTVAATSVVGTGPASVPSTVVTPTAVAQGPSVAVLPAMSNGAYGGYLTTAYLENLGASAAHIRVQYFDTSGHGVGIGNSVAGLAAGGTWTLRTDNGDSLLATQPGSAVVYSDQPLAVFVNEFAPGNSSDATSYTAINVATGTGSTIYAPAIANNAYGGYTTGIGLINLATTSANITVAYRDNSGTVIKTQTLVGVAAGAYQGLYSGDVGLGLPNGFAGTATITSSTGNLAAIVNETGPGGQFSSYDAVPSGSMTLYAPVALNNAYGGYNTGMGIQNTTGTAGTVTITYFDNSGTPTISTFPIVANGYLGVYQGNDIPIPGAYTAKVTSTVPIAAIVVEVASSSTSAKQSTAYNTFASGAASIHLPLVESAGSDGWSTGEGIMNTGTAATTVTVTYYDPVSGAQVGSPQSVSLQPNAFWGLYQPLGGLPDGTRANGVVTTSGGQVAVICNESNATSFMSYGGQ